MRQPRTNPRPAAELVAEMHDELYEAVYAGETDEAKAKLDELAMVAGGSLGDRIRAAKGRASCISANAAPEWACQRACDLVNEVKPGECRYVPEAVPHFRALTAFARYIAQHEQPPVDPDLELAREVCAKYFAGQGCHEVAGNYRAGEYFVGEDDELTIALAAIKAAREQSA